MVALSPYAFWQRARALWGRWLFIPLLPTLYALGLSAAGELRTEHIAFALVCAALGFASAKSKAFLVDISPYVAVGIGYDLVRYVRPFFVTADRVLGCELRDAELLLFSAGPNFTFQDYFAAHHGPVLDLIFAIPYTIFVYLVVVYAAYLFVKDRPRMRRYLLAFAIANYISFACWLLFPAAPPWYLRAHGCAIDVSAAPSPAALSRVDALLGTQYYANFYSRASSIFGAMPSMHCAYPLIGLLTAWRAATSFTRLLHVLYTAVMFAAAVYLDHHWVLDGIAGWLTAIVSVSLAGLVLRQSHPLAGPALLEHKVAAKPATVVASGGSGVSG